MAALQFEALPRGNAGRAVNAHVGHLALPARQVRLQRRPALEGVTGDGVLLDVTHPVLGLALGAGAKRGAGPDPDVPVPAERLEAAVEPDLARLRIVRVHERLGVVDQQRPHPPAEMGKGRLDAGKPGTLAFVPQRAGEAPPRVAQRCHKQEHPHRLAADHHAHLPEVDLHLLTRRRLEADRRPARRLQFLAEPPARPFDRAQARLDPQLPAQLLTDHVAVAPVLQEALPQPRRVAVQHTAALRLPVGHRAARGQITPYRIARNPQRPGDPLRSPTRLAQPNDGRDRL